MTWAKAENIEISLKGLNLHPNMQHRRVAEIQIFSAKVSNSLHEKIGATLLSPIAITPKSTLVSLHLDDFGLFEDQNITPASEAAKSLRDGLGKKIGEDIRFPSFRKNPDKKEKGAIALVEVQDLLKALEINPPRGFFPTISR